MKKLLALLSAAAMLVAFAACGAEKEEETTTFAENTTASEEVNLQEEETANEESEDLTETVTDESGEAVTDESGETVTEKVTKEEGTTKKEESKTEKATSKNESSDPKTTAEIISYCNEALNAVKTKKAGYTKRAVMQVNGNVAGLPQWLVSIFQNDETKTLAKGESKNDDFPVAGYEWSSKLREQDVASATIKKNGTEYEIMIKLGNEKNPKKGTSSSYGRAMSVIDAGEAADLVPGLKSVDMLYHDGYIHAKIDSETGRLTYAEISATADASANISLLGEVKAEDIKSIETYTNFVW